MRSIIIITPKEFILFRIRQKTKNIYKINKTYNYSNSSLLRYKSSNSTWVVVIKGAISPVTSFKGATVVKTEDEEIKEEVEMVEEEGRKDVEKEEVLWEVEDMGTVPSNSEISR